MLKEYLYKLSTVKPRHKPRIVFVNQDKNALLIGLFARDKGLADIVAYNIDGVPPITIVDGRIYFIGRLSGGELVSFTSCLYEAVTTSKVLNKLVDSIIIITEEHCLWCIPFIQGACKLSYRDGYIVNIVDFNYKSTIWYDKLGIDEVPALIHKGKLVSTGSPEDPEQAYQYIKKVLEK